MYKILSEDFISNKEKLRNNTLKRILSKNPTFDIHNYDYSFLNNPLLLAHLYHSKNTKINLSPFVIGYSRAVTKSLYIKLPNESDSIYISNVGYALPKHNSEVVSFSINKSGSSLKIDEENVSYQSVNYIKDSKIEVPLYNNTIIELIANEDPRQHKKQLSFMKKKDIESKMYPLENALNIIRKIHPTYYELIEDNLKMIIFYNAAYPHNFSALEYSGAIFLSPPKQTTNIWYVDSIIHEFSHNYLNVLLINFEEYFTINPFSQAFSSPFRNKTQKRGLFHIVHALFVIANLCDFYTQLIVTLSKKDNTFLETVGRLVTNINFLKNGILEIDYPQLYTKKGTILIEYIKNTLVETTKKNELLLIEYKSPHDSDNHIFSLENFKQFNNIH